MLHQLILGQQQTIFRNARSGFGVLIGLCFACGAPRYCSCGHNGCRSAGGLACATDACLHFLVIRHSGLLIKETGLGSCTLRSITVRRLYRDPVLFLYFSAKVKAGVYRTPPPLVSASWPKSNRQFLLYRTQRLEYPTTACQPLGPRRTATDVRTLDGSLA